jgi:hypothetical protein
MFHKAAKPHQVRMQRVKTFAVGLLLLLYIGGNVQVESFHQFFHSLEKAIHSSDAENDPCHRAIYHEAKTDGCDHKTHVTAIKKCPLCHVVPINEQLVDATYVFESFAPSLVFVEQAFSFLISDTLTHLPARAPPVS